MCYKETGEKLLYNFKTIIDSEMCYFSSYLDCLNISLSIFAGVDVQDLPSLPVVIWSGRYNIQNVDGDAFDERWKQITLMATNLAKCRWPQFSKACAGHRPDFGRTWRGHCFTKNMHGGGGDFGKTCSLGKIMWMETTVMKHRMRRI